MRAEISLVACLALAACPAPADVTPIIHVDPRAAQRIALLGGLGSLPSQPAKPAGARVHAMSASEALGGPNATGRAGDLMLENAEVVFVLRRDAGDSTTLPNCGLVDAADAHTRKDELGHMVPSFGTGGQGPPCDAIASGTESDGSAWVEARGRGVTTRYTLHAPDRALLVETTLENTSETPLVVPALGDAIDWGSAEKFAPGQAHGFTGSTSGAYIGAVGHFTSYALTSTEGNVDATSGDRWTTTVQVKNVAVAPHEKTTYARVFVVGARADTSSLVAELAMAAGQPVGAVKIRPRSPTPGLAIALAPEGGTETLTMVEPFEGVLPVGRYRITAPAADPAQMQPVEQPRFEVRADVPAEIALP